MNNTWVLVANASTAHLYATERLGEEMSVLKEFSHSESRAKGSTLASDRPGSNQSRGSSMGSMGDPLDPKEFEAERFATELAKEMDKGRVNRDFRRLVLVAVPHFQGLLKSHLNNHTRAMVVNSINKDFTAFGTRELPGRLKGCV
ncbi:host attachment protein [Amphritea sp. HPY]|uniref:host attachment protein n=1 Tax=Amphritea sp. HPY TaxID=3421652 RepID=UPI003D7E2308